MFSEDLGDDDIFDTSLPPDDISDEEEEDDDIDLDDI